ncbi:hypothetical protein J437_LFUL008947, partial [Ladona fulva]
MITTAKECTTEGKFLTGPCRKKGNSLPLETENFVKAFYERRDVSRIMPGKKDFVSLWKSGMKEHVQKRLILSNMKELNSHFKEEYADLKIGFSKFALMRPKNWFIRYSLRLRLGICYECPGTMKIREPLEEAFEMALVDNLIYSQWVSVDRTTLEIFQKE